MAVSARNPALPFSHVRNIADSPVMPWQGAFFGGLLLLPSVVEYEGTGTPEPRWWLSPGHHSVRAGEGIQQVFATCPPERVGSSRGERHSIMGWRFLRPYQGNPQGVPSPSSREDAIPFQGIFFCIRRAKCGKFRFLPSFSNGKRKEKRARRIRLFQGVVRRRPPQFMSTIYHTGRNYARGGQNAGSSVPLPSPV